MAEPIVISMRTWNSLSAKEKKAVAEVGLKLEGRALEIAMALHPPREVTTDSDCEPSIAL